MRIIKRILYFIIGLIMFLCLTVMVCAFNPALTQKIAGKVPQIRQLFGMEAEEENLEYPPDESPVSDNQNVVGVYVPPAQEDVVLPESVKDKIGYEPVLGIGEQISDEDAASIEDALGTGETGNELTFDTLFYPYYGMLDRNMQTLYRQIYANAMELSPRFVPAVTVSVDQVRDVFEAVCNDHPQLFWMETEYSCKYVQDRCVEISLRYYWNKDELEEARQQFEKAADKLIKSAKELETAAEKEKYVHDMLIQTVDYHAGTPMNQSAYSALVNGRSVCAGYARAFQYILMELGIPCYYCTGYSGGDHAWNIVKLDDGYYNVDVTWDDTQPSTCDYFNKTDVDYAKTHVRKSLSVKLPVCNADDYRKGPSADKNVQVDEDTDDEDTDEGDLQLLLPEYADTDELINPNPQEPLTWNPGTDEDAEWQAALDDAGLRADQVMDTLEKYYADCKEQMVKAGTGQKQFVSVIPKSLWETIEQEYSDGSYEKGYVKDALKEMGMENFAIQLQTQRINGTFYRLYHNISTW